MFVQTCQKLNFPEESIPVLEKAYQEIMADPEIAQEFQKLCDYFLELDCGAFQDAMPAFQEKVNVNPYTLNRVMHVCCVEPLRRIYQAEGLSEESFWNTMSKLRDRMLDCMADYHVWGDRYGFWQMLFHEHNCFRLGRLVFEPMKYFCDVPYEGIKKGVPAILIHIPGDGKLDMDAVMESLRQGYEFFKDRFPDGIVPFYTGTWLLYPPYMESVFPKGGNIQKFASLFHVVEQHVDETYENFPSVFGCQFADADFDKLPQDTTLQRNLLAFLKQGNPMGAAFGAFYYGENGIIA